MWLSFLSEVLKSTGVERSAAQACEVVRGKAELAQDFLVRNAFATIEGGAGSGDLTSFFLSDRLIVNGSIGETVSHGISHHFEQMNDGGNLAGSQPLDQFMGLLFFVRGCHQS